MAFLGVPVRRGEVVRARVPIGDFADGSPVQLPVVTVGGARAGPTVYLQGGLHGEEQTGIEVCLRLLRELDPAKLSGAVVCVPIAHVPAYLARSRASLHEERWLIDVNRIFPGKRDGLLTERIAGALFEEFVMPADLTIDLHSAIDGAECAAVAWIDPDNDDGGSLGLRTRLAMESGLPFVCYERPTGKIGMYDNVTRSLTNQADAARKPCALFEMGESRRTSVSLALLGVRAIHNALKVMGLEQGKPAVEAPPRVFSQYTQVHAKRGGNLRLSVDLGAEVVEGAVIGEVVDVFGQTAEELRAPVGGCVLRVMRFGAINTGAEVAWIGR